MTWPISEILAPSPDGTPGTFTITPDVGKRIDDPGDIDRLRTMRAAALAAFPFTLYVLVRDSETPYRLYIRDELPAETVAAIEAFRGGRGL
jgi:hypothetical protein